MCSHRFVILRRSVLVLAGLGLTASASAQPVVVTDWTGFTASTATGRLGCVDVTGTRAAGADFTSIDPFAFVDAGPTSWETNFELPGAEGIRLIPVNTGADHAFAFSQCLEGLRLYVEGFDLDSAAMIMAFGASATTLIASTPDISFADNGGGLSTLSTSNSSADSVSDFILEFTGCVSSVSLFYTGGTGGNAVRYTFVIPAAGQPLDGAGFHIPIPSPNPSCSYRCDQSETRVIDANGFTASWSSPVFPAWAGSFTATGPYPSGTTNPAGTTDFNFTGMPTGSLPAGTYFRFGDVDKGSGEDETITLTAFDSNMAPIITPWLDHSVRATGTTAVVVGSMPGWVWHGAPTGAYTIDPSTTLGGGINVAFYLPTNTDISFLRVVRFSSFANFQLVAPSCCPGDANGDGCVNFADITEVLARWLAKYPSQ